MAITARAGRMKRYLVGGAVRDTLLEIEFKDRDWVVTGASIGELLAQGYQYADKKAQFPVFIDPQTGEEVALARREIKTGTGYRGFEIQVDQQVTIEEDLARRDLTINAIAQDENGHLIDPFHGQADLEQGLLRHVSPAFCEDPVRLLRIARFSAKLGCWGFHIAHGTHGLMKKMVKNGEVQNLQPQRIWQELKKALDEPQPWQFFQVLHRCNALEILFPALAQSMGIPNGHQTQNINQPLKALKLGVKKQYSASMLYALVFYFSVPMDTVKSEKKYQNQLLQLHLLSQFIKQSKLMNALDYYLFLKQFKAFQSFEPLKQAIDCLDIILTINFDVDALKQLDPLKQMQQINFQIDIKKLQKEGYKGETLGQQIKQLQIAKIQNCISYFKKNNKKD